MEYSLVKLNNKNSFYPVAIDAINDIENDLGIAIPKGLKEFYLEVGYGFIKGSEYNANLIMAPYSVRDFRMRKNDFEFFPDIEVYDEFEVDKIIFFKSNESALMSIGFDNAIYYYDVKIADSILEFLCKMQENDSYYEALFF